MFRIHFRGFISILPSLGTTECPGLVLGALHRDARSNGFRSRRTLTHQFFLAQTVREHTLTRLQPRSN